jgi:hypothetical protein
MKRGCLALLGMLLFCSSSFAAQKTLSWESASSKGFCQNTLRFDPAKYFEASLLDTIHLIFGQLDIRSPSIDGNFRKPITSSSILIN